MRRKRCALMLPSIMVRTARTLQPCIPKLISCISIITLKLLRASPRAVARKGWLVPAIRTCIMFTTLFRGVCRTRCTFVEVTSLHHLEQRCEAYDMGIVLEIRGHQRLIIGHQSRNCGQVRLAGCMIRNTLARVMPGGSKFPGIQDDVMCITQQCCVVRAL